MTTSKSAITVTIVSSDIDLLRELYWTLSSFGYSVTASSDWSADAAWRIQGDAGIVLFDGRDTAEVTKVLAFRDEKTFTYRIVLRPNGNAEDSEHFLSAGADDLVEVPINVCELLTRLRCAVRRLEFERRQTSIATRDSHTDLLTQQGLISRVEKLANSPSSAADSQLVFLACDFSEIISTQFGYQAIRRISQAIADAIKQFGQGAECAALDACHFAVLLSNSSYAEAEAFAGRVARKISQSSALAQFAGPSPSLSAVILQPTDRSKPAESFEYGRRMLDYAQSHGGNAVLAASAVETAFDNWKSRMEEGEPFHSVVARDVMEAFPIVVSHDRTKAALSHHTRIADIIAHDLMPPCIPVVDGDSLLVGMINIDAVRSASEKNQQLLVECIAQVPATVQHDQPISEVFDAFSQHDCDLLVVADDKVPLGYVTRESLAALIADPINTATYFRSVENESSASRFVVPIDPVSVQLDCEQASERSTVIDDLVFALD